MKRNPKHGAVLSMVSASAIILATGGAAPKAYAQASALTDEIIVSARKREENVQDVPLSVTALGADQIDALKIRDLSDLSVGIPNVALDDVGTQRGTANFSIRGLGINSTIPSIEPTVGTFVDGVYMGVNAGLVFDLFDLESIEVLRGPQGILFGRNVTGGAILLNTRKPGDEFEGRVRIAVDGGGDGGANYYVMGSVGSPVSDTLKLKLAAYYNDDQGWFENLNTGEDFGALEQVMIRPMVVWTPTPNSELTLRYEYTNIDGDGPAGQSHTNGSGVPGAPENFDRESFDFSINTEGYHESESHFAAAEFTIDVGDNGRITNIFGYRNLEQDSLTDLDAQPLSLFDARFQVNSEQFSNELRYNGRIGEKFDVTAGLYFFKNNVAYAEGRRLLGLATPDGSPALTQDGGGEHDVETYAAFLAVDYAFTDRLTLTAGLRYSYEEKSVNIASLNLNTNAPCNIIDETCAFDFIDDESWDALSPKVGATYDVNDNARVYAHWARGFRSGGYNLRNTSPDTVNFGPGPFDQEQVDNFEVGFKSEWGFGFLNAALFYNNIQDMQREVVLSDPSVGVVQLIRNTADASVLGVEAEGVFSLTDSLVLNTSLGWLDAEYNEIFFDLNSDGMIDEADEALELPRAPELTYSVGLVHDLEIGELGLLSSRVSYSYRDEAAFSDDNLGFITDQEILNAGLDFRTAGGNWTFSLYGQNLLNTVKHGGDGQLPATLGGVPLGGTFAPLSKGRVYGAQLTLEF